MFSHELFDFASTGHLSDAHIDAPDPYHDALFDSYIDSSCVDQSFCSDFACCGQALPDLHRLLEHFEEDHVLPLPSDARPLFSSPVYAQPRSGSCTSYILSYPQPDPPLHTPAAPHSIPASPTPRGVLPSLQFSEIPPVAIPDLTHTPLSPSPTTSSATSAHSSPEPGEPLCLPPALFSFQPNATSSRSRGLRDRPRGHATSDTDEDVDMYDSDEEGSTGADGGFEDTPPRTRSAPTPTSSVSGNTAGPHRRVKNKTSAARMEPFAAARRSPSERAPSSPKRRDGREKAFKCPCFPASDAAADADDTVCVPARQSYLNPNGLKYHLEKGTCTNADARARDPLPPSSPSSVVASRSASVVPAAATMATTLETGPDSMPPSGGVADADDAASSAGPAEVRA
ncbi:hypothetical protein GSI_11143 [Ganoderma sinense ZZ0214-1]|uniref:Transcription factor n=1 Tax=Ganoderma sinense ZZ0214-1 TaxID=1077348 RepID=A0A2G8RZ91_9APHY|nr:hypothetical protein GSI_11143 [Ganoderma sinense ZZ0214-1]